MTGLLLLCAMYICVSDHVLSTSAAVNMSLTHVVLEVTADVFPPTGQMTHPEALS